MMNFKTPVILASSSPRRQELLAALGIIFDVCEAPVNETHPDHLTASEVPQFLARKKALAVSTKHLNSIIIAADTVVILDDHILGKPKDAVEALSFLQRLSGQKHQVVTGVCITFQDKIVLFHELTVVEFKPLSKLEMDHYIQNFHPFDKAGGYGIQEWIGMIGITGIEGSFYNVMGLPVQKVYAALKEFAEDNSV